VISDIHANAEALDRDDLFAVNFAVEELFTNMVKYNADNGQDILLDLRRTDDVLTVRLTDFGVEPFDVTQAPDADVTLPIEQRVPGGLGLHLTRRLVDAIEYVYIPERRESRITFRKTDPGRATAATVKG